MKIYNKLFDNIASIENIILSWEEFKKDKSKKIDVQMFEFSLEQNLFSLHHDLISKRYTHGHYSGFYIRDPKVRHIHKAMVRDRVLHHAVFRVLNPIFEQTFIANSFSCQLSKGTHKGVATVEKIIRRESHNYTRPCYALKCDVRKFFDSVDHEILLTILKKKITDQNTIWVIKQIVRSFSVEQTLFYRHGIPIGNLTSQLFANIYMNEFDQFVKHNLKVKNYARYTDDFIVISTDKKYLENLLNPFQKFINDRLKLSLHPQKCFIVNVNQGVDFLGYVILPHYRLLRSKTKYRIFRKLKYRVLQFRRGEIDKKSLFQSLQSYLGVFSHAFTYRLSQDLKNHLWYWINE